MIVRGRHKFALWSTRSGIYDPTSSISGVGRGEQINGICRHWRRLVEW